MTEEEREKERRQGQLEALVLVYGELTEGCTLLTIEDGPRFLFHTGSEATTLRDAVLVARALTSLAIGRLKQAPTC